MVPSSVNKNYSIHAVMYQFLRRFKRERKENTCLSSLITLVGSETQASTSPSRYSCPTNENEHIRLACFLVGAEPDPIIARKYHIYRSKFRFAG